MSNFLPKSIVICGYARTPIGSFLGSLSSLSAARLGALAISGALERAGLAGSDVENVVMGQVLSAGAGQAPVRQAALAAGIPKDRDVWSVNKVCSSGMKSAVVAAQAMSCGEMDVSVVGGMESMSRVPHVLGNAIDIRLNGTRLGHFQAHDLLVKDGLWDPYGDMHMGQCTEQVCKSMGIGREDQDLYCMESYKRALGAWSEGRMSQEVVKVVLESNSKGKHGNQPNVVETDEEFKKLKLDKVPSLKPAFEKNGTITAANASKLNDGAAALVLMTEERARKMGVRPLARIIGYADHAVEPANFAIAPTGAIQTALRRTKLTTKDVDFFEINEAFSAVALANMKNLNLDPSRVNVDGGAVSLGHPLGMSGARLLCSLTRTLHQRDAKFGVAGICNGGGGATSVIIERL